MATMNDRNDPDEVEQNMNNSNDFDEGYNDDVDSFREHEFPMLKGSYVCIKRT